MSSKFIDNLSIFLLPLVAVTALALPNAKPNQGLLKMEVVEDEKISGSFYPKETSSS